MYIGSVRFFRHLILTIVVLAIIIPVTATIILAVNNNSLKKEIEVLSAQIQGTSPNNASGTPDADPSNTDGAIPAMTKDPNLTSTTAGSTSAEVTEPEPIALPAYANLFPDLYVENYNITPQYVEDTGWIYFTFDDGPSQYTDTMLAHLRNFDIPGTFFVIPNENSERRLNQILAEGHAIGIHCFSHDYAVIYESVEAYLTDFKKAYDLLYEQTGYKAEIFRFPGGSKNDYNIGIRDDIIAEMTRRGFVYFDWSIDSDDSKGAGWTHMYNTVLNGISKIYDGEGAYKRSVILMHDDAINASMTVMTIDDILEALMKNPRDYKFGKLSRDVEPLQF
ncbi:MAG: polysaccharide deacetylase family protein [Oscillospiraceae bacterium]|nr:polysaccharide deacetylase family protein [Oscillospiraceae bacterium]